MLSVLISLGVWQILRLNYKNHIINEVKHNRSMPPIMIDFKDDHIYKNVRIRGRFINEKTIFYYRLKNNIPGYEILTPFVFRDNSCVLVSRGWTKEIIQIPLSNEYITVEGFVVGIYRKNLFNPKNDFERNMWFSLDIPDINRYTSVNCLPYVILLSSPEGVIIGEEIGFDISNLPNKHLEYSLTWFAMAAILIIIFVIDFKRAK